MKDRKDNDRPEAYRAAVPSDDYGLGGGYWQSGKPPAGGFQGMWCFDGSHDPKKSPTTRPGKKVV